MSSARPMIVGFACVALNLEFNIKAIQDAAASLCQQRLPLENTLFKISFNCKIIKCLHKANLLTSFLGKAAISKIDAFLKSLLNLGKTQNSFCLELLFLKLCFVQSFLPFFFPVCFLASMCTEK